MSAEPTKIPTSSHTSGCRRTSAVRAFSGCRAHQAAAALGQRVGPSHNTTSAIRINGVAQNSSISANTPFVETASISVTIDRPSFLTHGVRVGGVGEMYVHAAHVW